MEAHPYRCFACSAQFPVRETSEPGFGLLPDPLDCAQCGAPVRPFARPTEADARHLVTAHTGLARTVSIRESLSEYLRGRCATPEEVDRIIATLDRLDWDRWRSEFERYQSNESTGEWNRQNLVQLSAVLRARDDGSLRREIIAVSEQVKSDLITWAAQWRRTV